jgi:hypothetical protein
VTVRAHLDAFVALLSPLTGAPSSMRVVVGATDAEDQAPALPADRQTPFVVVRPDSMPMESDRLGVHSANLNGRVYVTCVGSTVKEAQWAQEKTRALLVDKKPTVAGRSVGRLQIDIGSPLQVDRDVTPPLFFVVDVYRYFSA